MRGPTGAWIPGIGVNLPGFTCREGFGSIRDSIEYFIVNIDFETAIYCRF